MFSPLDWNWNVGRAQKVDDLGEPQWKEKVNALFFAFVFMEEKLLKNLGPQFCLKPAMTILSHYLFFCLKGARIL